MADLLTERGLSAERPLRDRPIRTRRVSRDGAADAIGGTAAALAAIWLLFSVSGVSIMSFGFFFCWALLSFTLYGVLVWRRHGVLIMKDRLATVAVWSGAVIALAALSAVILYVLVKGWPIVWDHFPRFIVMDSSGGKSGDEYGVGQAIVGTLEQVFIATVISVPIAFLTATYLVESKSVLSRLVRNVVDAMTGTPSIIAGLFVYLIWVAPHGVNGKNGFVAALTLSIMMIPVTCRAALEVIRIVPGSLREAAHALGSSEWRVTLRVVLPAARTGLITAAVLGIARTAGETAEVLFTAGGSAHYNWNPFQGWQDDLPLRIYEQVFQPSKVAISVGWGAAFVLVVLVLILFTTARVLGSGRRFRPLAAVRRTPLPTETPQSPSVESSMVWADAPPGKEQIQ
jgi:phosphate transport system permease protein